MRILVVDDDEYWREHIEFLLKNYGFAVETADNWRSAIEILKRKAFDRLILDLNLGTGKDDGLFMLSAMEVAQVAVPTMVLSYYVDLHGVTGICYHHPCVTEVIPKERFVEFSFPFQRFLKEEHSGGTTMSDQSRVFLVHGRDLQARDRIVRILSELRTIPVFLEREASGGRTIIELVEAFTDVSYCVALMNACDKGFYKNEPSLVRPRARQNVVFEIGYIMGRLGRERILLLSDDIEMPSDLTGLRWVTLSLPDHEIKTAIVRDFQRLGNIRYEL